MRPEKILNSPFIFIISLALGIWYIARPFPIPKKMVEAPQAPRVQKNMKLASSAFASEEEIPLKFTCDGLKFHPPFTISGVPDTAKSLAMIVDDPDAPAGTFTHWVIWNIHPKTTEIDAGVVPSQSQEGTNSSGGVGYVPPCPPPGGSHRYFFTLFAVDTTIGLDGKAKKAELEKAMSGHIIEQTNLIGSYERRSR